VSIDPLRPGDRVRIVADRETGSVKLLDGLTAEILGPHPIAKGWFKICLDENAVTANRYWPVPGARLLYLKDNSQI
jgi:hypothetical protein